MPTPISETHDTAEHWKLLAIVAAAYLTATGLTTWLFVGDAPDYARSIISQFAGGDCNFVEFGHLLWRSTGYLVLSVTGRHVEPGSATSWVHALSVLNAISWVAGLVTVLALALWLRKVTGSLAATLIGVAFVIANKSFLNFSQVGTSYVTALCFLVLALAVGSMQARSRAIGALQAIAAGVALGASMLYWAPFVFVAPGALLAPLLLSKEWRERLPRVVITAAVCTLCMLTTYAWVGSILGLHSLSAYRAWVADAQHGITFGGPARAAIGLARFVVDLGDFGPRVKRFLVHDPYTTVTLSQLFNFDLVKMGIVYAFAALAAVMAWRARIGWQRLAFFAIALGPILVFGIFWQGGDLERFLPALPMFALVVALAYIGARDVRWASGVMIGVVVFIALINGTAMFAPTVQRIHQESVDRLTGLSHDALTKDVLVVSHWHDPLMATMRDNPFDERVGAGLTIYPLITTGMPRVPMWREDFSKQVVSTWQSGKQVWVSTRLMALRPESTWAWTEGDDPRIAWKEFHEYFDSLSYDQSAGPNKEFFLLSASPANRAKLESDSAVVSSNAIAVAPAAAPACRPVKLFHPGT